MGTGRIALPLTRSGVAVDGIELSQDMVDRMREKPGGDEVNVTIGDMSRVGTGRSYGLVYLVFNTIGNLLTQDDQVRCFENVASHLTDDGGSSWSAGYRPHPLGPVISSSMPRVSVWITSRWTCVDTTPSRRSSTRTTSASVPTASLSVPSVFAWLTPPEFDLMARIAGLRLRNRWGGWREEPFDSTSWRHISVYERAMAQPE